MCGIAGYRKLSGHTVPFDQHVVHDLHAALDHRGPDGYGTWVSSSAQIALAHRRLSIIDLSDAGHQPMLDHEQQVVLVFNGEIYNYQLLRTQLRDLGHTFTSSTDTEVVIAAYKQWGIACINRFEGMFAFALFDQRTQDLHLVRDRFGIKPLYFSVQNQYLSFASELKALWHLPWIDKRNNYQAAYHYLTYLATPAPLTMYEDIYKLPAGFYLRCTAKNLISFHRWYDLATIGHSASDYHGMSAQDHVDTLRTLLRASIAKHMRSDVPVGVFLSGGLDSSLTVALMAEHADSINTFNVSFENAPELQERDWARLVSRQFNTQHHELILSESDAFDTFEQLRYYMDEPLADTVCVPLFAVARAARQAGVTVVQIGEGADELFGGYTSYVDYMRVQRWWGPLQRYMPAVLQRPFMYAAERTPLTDTKRELLHNFRHGRSLFYGSAIGFGPHKKKDIWYADGLSYAVDPMVIQMYPGFLPTGDSYAFIDYHRSHLYASKDNVDFLQEVMYLEFANRVPELLLMRADTMTMASSLEARVPFLDHHLVEYAFAMPQKLKYTNGLTKYIVKKASEGLLPHEVIYRKKMGFAAPATRWFRSDGYFQTQLQDLLNSSHNAYAHVLNKPAVHAMLYAHNTVGANYGPQLWAIQNLLSHGMSE